MVWICVDVIAVFTYLGQGLRPTAALYTVFLIVASYGLYSWYKSWSRGEAVAA